MSIQVHISADYFENSGYRDVIDVFNKWSSD